MQLFFFFNDTATTEIYTLSLHDALPISQPQRVRHDADRGKGHGGACDDWVEPPEHRQRDCRGVVAKRPAEIRSEEHTSELQSRQYLVCRLLLEKKKKTI